jgi:TPP-dependent pyruvate/acetoin dehydrogenase alpha subunit
VRCESRAAGCGSTLTTTGEAMKPGTEQRLWMYETMWLIRCFEDTLATAYFEGKLPPKIQPKLAFDIGAGPIPGEMHLCAGQEPAAVGSCIHLRREDSMWGTHRTHHFAIAKGVDLDRMAAEIFGKVTGLCRGKGGHMHLFDTAVNFACTGMVGAGIPQAVGAALAYKKLGTGAIALAEFGEGASNQGAFHEALNMAGLWKLPCVFVCQDNNYGISVNKAASTAVESIATRAASYGMPGVTVAENDADQVFAAVGEAVARARAGEGPTLLELKVDRFYGHFQGDPESYRPKGEVESLRKKDALRIYEARLIQEGLLDDARVKDARARAKARVDAAVAFARQSNYPAAEEAFQHVFADTTSA